MFLPVFVFILIMYYWPMLGIRYAFYDYKPVGAPTFVGLKHFYSMFKTDAFWSAFRNTLELSIMKLLITTFTAVIVSIFLNEMGNLFDKENFADYYISAPLYVLGSSCIYLQLVPVSFLYRSGKWIAA